MKIGDRVLSFDSNNGGVKFSKVVSFLHRIENIEAHFVRIFYSDPIGYTNHITLTPKHLIMAKISNQTEDSSFEYVPADQVRIGSLLSLFDNYSFKNVSVIGIERPTLKKSGIYAPLTDSGTLIVDNIHVSCFSMVKNHYLAQLFYELLNKLNNLFQVSSETYCSYSKILFEILESTKLSNFFLNLN